MHTHAHTYARTHTHNELDTHTHGWTRKRARAHTHTHVSPASEWRPKRDATSCSANRPQKKKEQIGVFSGKGTEDRALQTGRRKKRKSGGKKKIRVDSTQRGT